MIVKWIESGQESTMARFYNDSDAPLGYIIAE
jgi:hypothetical protein